MLRTLMALTNKATRDDARFRILRRVGGLIMPSYRFGWPQLLWWKDQEFNAFLARFDELQEPNTDRRWMVHQLLKLIESVQGDTAECGVYKGATSYLICQAENGIPRTHFIFDSFEGLSQPTTEDGNYWTKGDLATSIERTRANLPFPNVSYHKGWIPDRFEDVADRRFAFVHIDVDLGQPTLDSLKFFYPRMNRGGIIVCDDYGFLTCPGATKAFDEFQRGKPEKIIAPPCGGGFIVKA
jgi:O-methyltransferase